MILALLLALAVPCPHPHRSKTQVHRFMKMNPCPSGPDRGSTKRCRGHVVDHVWPLECCGPDHPDNMQWQTTAAAKAKDKTERRCGRPR